MPNPFVKTADDYREDVHEACDNCKEAWEGRIDLLENENMALKDERDELQEKLATAETRWAELVETTSRHTDQAKVLVNPENIAKGA